MFSMLSIAEFSHTWRGNKGKTLRIGVLGALSKSGHIVWQGPKMGQSYINNEK